MTPWYFIMASDAQYPWLPKYDESPPETWAYGEDPLAYAVNQTAGMLSLIEEKQPLGLMFNGDSVTYNREPYEDLKGFKQFHYDVLSKKLPVYIGLGNHDYENNVGHTPEDTGPTQMVEFLWESLQEPQVQATLRAQDFAVLREAGSVSYCGSLAYSFVINGVCFIQLHNHPAYERRWSGGGRRCSLRSALPFLEQQLIKARQQGLAIVVCTHYPPLEMLTPEQQQEFCRMMYRYEVSAVFAAHYHVLLGRQEPLPRPAGWEAAPEVPVFHCGSASQASCLLLRFAESTMTVHKVSTRGGRHSFLDTGDAAPLKK